MQNMINTGLKNPSGGSPFGITGFAETIRIYHECEGRIEKSVLWHYEVCRVMTSGDPEGRIFLSYPHTNNGFFFLLTTVYLLIVEF